jgi:hypothetical protein
LSKLVNLGQTRQKFKEAYDQQFAATIERAEKQIILAKHARRLLNMVDDTPIVPGDTHAAFAEVEAARQVLNDAETDLQNYRLDIEPITSNSGHLGVGAMPGSVPDSSVAGHTSTIDPASTRSVSGEEPQYQETPYPVTDAERVEMRERQEEEQRHVSTAV